MQLSVRSYLTAGIAAVGATAIIAAPIAPMAHAPATAVPSMSAATADVQLASFLTDLADSVNFVIGGFQGAGSAVVNGVTSVASVVNSGTQTNVVNTAQIISQILSYLTSGTYSVVAGFENAANVFLPTPFDQALTDVVNGFLTAGSYFTLNIPVTLTNLGSSALITLSNTAYQLLYLAVQEPAQAANQIIDGFKSALSNAASFNFSAALGNVVTGVQSAVSILIGGAQAAAATLGSTVSTLFNIAHLDSGGRCNECGRV